jgi:hypothetical protein
MTAKSDELCIKKTVQWIKSFVIELNLCPFAKREMDKDAVKIQVSSAETIEEGLSDLLTEMEILNSNHSIETTFLLFPEFLTDFFNYLDFVDKAESLILAEDYEGIYQLASFHPDYCFADASTEDVENYTNRSPFPMLHILREARVEQAIAYYGDTNKIIENNKRCLQNLELDEVKRRLRG